MVLVVVDVPGILLKSAVIGVEPTNKLLPEIPEVKVPPPGAPNNESNPASDPVTLKPVPIVASYPARSMIKVVPTATGSVISTFVETTNSLFPNTESSSV